jgi:hypothetical protein
MRVDYKPNPDYTAKQIKDRKHRSKGFCNSAREQTKDWQCICKKLKESPVGTWCDECLFQKVEVE